MTKFIILLVIVLGVIALAQLVRMYELSSKLRNRREEEIPNRDNRLNATLLFTFMIVLFIGTIYLYMHYGWVGLGEAASVHGAKVDSLMNFNLIFVTAAFFIANFLLFYFAFKYVRKPGVKAYYFPHSNKLELIWTSIPAIFLTIVSVFGLKTWNEITSLPTNEAVRIELFSKQFDWTVRISGDDNQLGYFDYKLTNENNPLGLVTTKTIQDAIDSMENGATGIKALEAKLKNPNLIFGSEDYELMTTDLARKERMVRLIHQMKARHNAELDARANDDLVFNASDTLYLCKNQDYEFNFRAKDVIHSALFPHFRAQMNTVPGQTTRFKFTPTISTKEMREKMNDSKFHFVLLCNKICGSSHYKMKLIVVVLDKPEYDSWYKRVSTFDPANADLCKKFRFKYPVGKGGQPVAQVSDTTAVK